MSLLEDFKHRAEVITGIGRPREVETRVRKANSIFLHDDGKTPNNPRFPLVFYRSPIVIEPGYDPAACFEVLFAKHGWGDSWRDGIYPFLHFHTQTHEVLGFVRGRAHVQFGGARGRILELKPGDVVVLPAGTGHKRIRASRDLLVVGAYPKQGTYDEPKPGEVDAELARRRIQRVPAPPGDPVYGVGGPLRQLWKMKS